MDFQIEGMFYCERLNEEVNKEECNIKDCAEFKDCVKDGYLSKIKKESNLNISSHREKRLVTFRKKLNRALKVQDFGNKEEAYRWKSSGIVKAMNNIPFSSPFCSECKEIKEIFKILNISKNDDIITKLSRSWMLIKSDPFLLTGTDPCDAQLF